MSSNISIKVAQQITKKVLTKVNTVTKMETFFHMYFFLSHEQRSKELTLTTNKPKIYRTFSARKNALQERLALNREKKIKLEHEHILTLSRTTNEQYIINHLTRSRF